MRTIEIPKDKQTGVKKRQTKRSALSNSAE